MSAASYVTATVNPDRKRTIQEDFIEYHRANPGIYDELVKYARHAKSRGWDRLGIAKEHFVEYNGKPVLSVKKAFRKVVKLAGIDISEGNVTPHTLRHTAATWLMQLGVNLWTAAGYLGMTVEVLERTYGHHHPDHLSEAVEAITTKKAKRAS